MLKKIAPIIVLLFAGCATHKAEFIPAQPSDRKGSVVYVYRAGGFSSLVLAPEITIENDKGEQTSLGKLAQGEYKLLYLLPGKYEIQLESIKYYAPGNALAIDVPPGSVNYLQMDASLKFEAATRYKAYERKYNLRMVDAAIARDIIADCIDVDSKPVKKNIQLNAGVSTTAEGLAGSDGDGDNDASFSIDKTSDPFSRNQ